MMGDKPLKELQSSLSKLTRVEVEQEAAKNRTEWSWKIHPAQRCYWYV